MKSKSKNSSASSALVGAAILHVLPGLWSWILLDTSWDINYTIWIGGSAFLLMMAVWARWMPFAPMVISSALYALFIGIQVQQGVSHRSMVSWILQGTIIMLLAVGLVKASGHKELISEDSE